VRYLSLLFLALVALAAVPASAQPDRDEDDGDEPRQPVTEIVVTAQRLDVARARIEPSLGASTYTLSNEAVENRPSGETTNLAQILLQAPGVAQTVRAGFASGRKRTCNTGSTT